MLLGCIDGGIFQWQQFGVTWLRVVHRSVFQILRWVLPDKSSLRRRDEAGVRTSRVTGRGLCKGAATSAAEKSLPD